MFLSILPRIGVLLPIIKYLKDVQLNMSWGNLTQFRTTLYIRVYFCLHTQASSKKIGTTLPSVSELTHQESKALNTVLTSMHTQT
jgi:hypothetical protein